MEGLNSELFRNNLASKIRELKKENDQKAIEFLKELKVSEEYNLALKSRQDAKEYEKNKSEIVNNRYQEIAKEFHIEDAYQLAAIKSLTGIKPSENIILQCELKLSKSNELNLFREIMNIANDKYVLD